MILAGLTKQNTAFKFFVQFTFYAAIWYTVIIAVTALRLRALVTSGSGIDGFVIATLAISGIFGMFTWTMTLTGIRYMCINLTNVDYVKSKVVVHQLAIRVPRGTPPGPDYGVITYPLPKPPPPPPAAGQGAVVHETPSERDLLAQRTFAIVKTEMGENPWDLGVWRNWKAAMGSNVLDWLLPFNNSPCLDYESDESMYEMGPLLEELKTRFNLPRLSAQERGLSCTPTKRGRSKYGNNENEKVTNGTAT